MDVIDTGNYIVNAPCPRCGQVEEIAVAVRSVLTTPQDEIGSLKVSAKGKARDHDCHQRRLVVEVDTPLEDEPEPAPCGDDEPHEPHTKLGDGRECPGVPA